MKKQPLSLRAKALALLAGREYSRAELARKLNTYARKLSAQVLDDDVLAPARSVEIDELLAEFTLRGWLSEERFVEQSVNRMAKRYGARRVVQELQSKGIKTESVQGSLPYLDSVALATARAVLSRKFRGVVQSPDDRSRRVRFLQGRGFDYDVIRKALRDGGDDEEA